MRKDWPDFDTYSHETLLDVYEKIDEVKYPNRKVHVRELIESGHHKNIQDPSVSVQSSPPSESIGVAIADPRYNTFFQRFWAGWIDGLVLLMLTIGFELLAGLMPESTARALVMFSAFSPYFYSVVLHSLYGYTIGKAMMGVKVVKVEDESKIDFRHALVRDLVPIVLLVVSLIALPGVIEPGQHYKLAATPVFYQIAVWASLVWFLLEIGTMLLDEKRRALHDYMAGTVVVKSWKSSL